MNLFRNGRDVDGTGATRGESAIQVMAGGHRENGLQSANRALLERAIGHILDLIARRSPGTPRLLVSLAEGADRLIIAGALAREWPITAVLPFARDEFARDFETAPSQQEYQDMLVRADRVIALPGDRGATVGDGAAYAAANQVMLDQADLVLSVWDGEPARGPGGTAEVVAQARARGLPVIWIAAQPPHGLRLLDPESGNAAPPWWHQLAEDLIQPAARLSAESG